MTEPLKEGRALVEKIAEMKDMLLGRMEQVINERGVERADLAETGKLADQIKDLAEAEKACWEAEYYMSVAEAMESKGYMPEEMGYEGGSGGYGGSSGYGGGSGYSGGGSGGSGGGGSRGYRRRGYNSNRDSRGRYSRGYHEEIDGIREAMRTASPEDKEKMQRELRQMLNM